MTEPESVESVEYLEIVCVQQAGGAGTADCCKTTLCQLVEHWACHPYGLAHKHRRTEIFKRLITDFFLLKFTLFVS